MFLLHAEKVSVTHEVEVPCGLGFALAAGCQAAIVNVYHNVEVDRPILKLEAGRKTREVPSNRKFNCSMHTETAAVSSGAPCNGDHRRSPPWDR